MTRRCWMFESLNSRNDRVIPGLRMLKVGSMTNQQPHWGVCQQCRFPGPSPDPWNQNFWKRWASQLLFYLFFQAQEWGEVWRMFVASLEINGTRVLVLWRIKQHRFALCLGVSRHSRNMFQTQLKQLKYKSLLAPPRKNTLLRHTALTNEWEK